MPESPTSPLQADTLRVTHLGHWMHRALERFDTRVLELMAAHPAAPLALAHLAQRQQVGAAQVHITRHLPREGARLVDLARLAGMSKQAMGTLVNQCEAWGMVQREPDPIDARARRIRFTSLGLAWLQAYEDATRQAEIELREAVGDAVATVLSLGLEAYASH